MVEEVIHQFEGKLRSLLSENETLRLQLHKETILAQARLSTVDDQQSAIDGYIAQNSKLAGIVSSLQKEVDDCYKVIENLSADNRELKLENEDLKKVQVQLEAEQQKARIFQDMYLQVTARTR